MTDYTNDTKNDTSYTSDEKHQPPAVFDKAQFDKSKFDEETASDTRTDYTDDDKNTTSYSNDTKN